MSYFETVRISVNGAVLATGNPMPVTGSVTATVSGSVSVSNFPATQPVSGTVAVSNFPATQPVSGTVTANAGTNLNTSLLALEAGGNLAAIKAKTDNLTADPSTATLQGALTEAAPATDTASSGQNGRLQRIAQRLTSLIALIPAALTGSGNFKVALVESTASQAVTGTFFQATQPVSAASLPLPSGASTEATLALIKAKTDLLPNIVGTWNYVSATLTGAGTVTGSGRCVGIRVFASAADGTFNINGGNTITVRSGTGVDIDPRGQVTAPVVNWVSGTLDILVTGVT